MDDRTCQECGQSFNDGEGLRRHVKVHSVTFQEYSLKWVYGGHVPKCVCGCGQETSWNVALKGYAQYVRGHSSKGREPSAETRVKIGEKNSIHMKRFMSEHPEIAQLRNSQMRSAHTPELEQRRLEATRQAYASMTVEEKQQFADRVRVRWQRGEMDDARQKAAETFRQRSSAGEYDFEERNQKLSEAISQKYVNGEWQFTKGFHVSTKTGQKCYYRSAWELQLMQELDADPDVIDWQSEFISLPYVFDGVTHRYVPDFHVTRHSNGHSLVEVKPQALRMITKNVAKRDVALAFCAERGWHYVEWAPVVTRS